ncbi:hypothetical protein, partial [Escherichia coli]|uniref:hypothetical protein n=2 Tax=Escherichia coli TaxID=562 RepID=UPI002072E563
WLMMSLWDALRMNMMISYQELVRTFPNYVANSTGWQINKAGTILINGSGGTGRMVISNDIIQIYDLLPVD